MNKKTISALVLSAALALTGCSGTKTQSLGEKNSYDDTVVATVAGTDIYLSDFNFAYYTTAGYYTQYMGADDWENQEMDGEKLGDYVRESSLNEMKQLAVAETKAEEYGVKVDSKMLKNIEDQKKSVIDQNFGGEDGYKEYLDSYFTSDAAIGRYLLRATIVNDLLAAMSKEGGECEVTDEDIAADYNDDNYYKVKHVLISTQPTTNDDGEEETKTPEQALAEANEVIARLNAGEDIDKLIEEYNDDPGMESQEYYVFTEGEMVDSFYEASKALEIGSWTQEPVESSYGYHVIERYPLDIENDDKVEELRTSRQQEKFMEILNGWTDEADSTVDDAALDKAIESQREAAAAKEAEAAAQNDDAAAPDISAPDDEADAGEGEEASVDAADGNASASAGETGEDAPADEQLDAELVPME